LDWLVLAVVWVYVAAAPYNKVEESFNIQASHDLLYHRLDVDSYDHLEFPGVVPRTFLGPLAVLPLVAPVERLLVGQLQLPKLAALYAVRLAIGLLSVLAFARFRSAVAARYGSVVATWLALITCCQFHLPFYMSRGLGNVFALALVHLAFAEWLQGRMARVIYVLTFTCAVFRSEVILLFGPIMLQAFLRKEAGIVSSIGHGLVALALSIGLTVGVDSFFWQHTLWPEGSVFWYNAILGKSVNWGTSPAHWYFTSAMPRALLAALPLAGLGMALGWRRLHRFVLPVLAFVAIYSCQPHKELRFIFYAFPIVNMAAAFGLARTRIVGLKSAFMRLLFLAAVAALALSLCFSGAFLYISSMNYPGGHAFAQLHAMRAAEAGDSRRVHIDVPAAMQGVCRFGEEYAAWEYSKEEGLDSREGFDLLVTADAAVAGFRRFAAIDGFAGLRWESVPQIPGLRLPLPELAPRMFLHEIIAAR